METPLLPQLIFPENWTCEIPPAAWRQIAKAYRTEPEDRTEFEDRLTRRGICYAIILYQPDDPNFMETLEVIIMCRLSLIEVIKANRHHLPYALGPAYLIGPIRCEEADYREYTHGRHHDLMRAEFCEQIADFLSSKPPASKL